MQHPSHRLTFVPYHFRPFWHPNSRPASPVARHQDITQLSEKLDAAEKQIIEYAQLIATLSAEIRRYQTIICHDCKEKIFHASLATPTPTSWSIQPASRPITPTINLSEIPSSIEPSDLSPHDQLSGTVTARSSSSGRNHLAEPMATTSSLGKPQVALSFATVSTALPYSADAISEPGQQSISETTTNPDWSVEYNPEIDQSLSVDVADTFQFSAKVFCSRFSNDGKYLAVGLENGETHIYDMMTGSQSILAERSVKVFYSEAAKIPPRIRAVRFSPNNKYVATGGSRGQIKIWEVGRRRVRANLEHHGSLNSLDLSSDGRFIVSASSHIIYMWRLRDGSRRRFSFEIRSRFVSVAFSSDGRYVVAGNDGGLLRIWDTRIGHLVVKYKTGGHKVYLRSVVFTPDGKGVASGGGDILHCWDVSFLRGNHPSRDMITTSQMDHIFEFKGHTDTITAVSFSSDNRWVVSGSLDHSLCILDAHTGSWMCRLRSRIGPVWGASFSSAGEYVVCASQDCQVRLWRCKSIK